ncbi:MAG: hypothetical protein R2690_08375 [Acidimicrobiales bacterium]
MRVSSDDPAIQQPRGALVPSEPTPLPGTDRPFEIAPSVLPVDFANFGQACVDLVEAGVDRIQFDIMDGRFVPNLTFGPDLVASVRSWSTCRSRHTSWCTNPTGSSRSSSTPAAA